MFIQTNNPIDKEKKMKIKNCSLSMHPCTPLSYEPCLLSRIQRSGHGGLAAVQRYTSVCSDIVALVFDGCGRWWNDLASGLGFVDV